MSRNKFSKDFYKDLDKKKKGGCCSFWAIAIFLILIFILIVLGGWYVKNKVVEELSYIKKPTSEISRSSGVIGKIEEESKTVASGESATVSISEEEVSEYFGIYNDNFPLKGARLNVESKGIEITGKTKNTVISLPVTVLMVPYIDDNELQIRVESINSGIVSLPKSARDAIENYLNDIVAKKSLTVADFELSDVSTREDYVDVTGVKK